MIQNINTPLTLIYGSSSELLRRSDVDDFVQATNGAFTIWLDGGHNLHHEATDAVAGVIDERAFGFSREERALPVLTNDVIMIR
jgi:pimeloyl-ACP methyl ester carboxylesterase